jgi:DNA gyrase subunit A
LIGTGGRDTLYLFEARGAGAAVAVHTLPECDDPKDGIPVARATAFTGGEQVVAGVAIPAERSQLPPEACLLLGTFRGVLKKTLLESLPGPSSKPFNGINVGEGDVVGWARITLGGHELMLVSSSGQAIRFKEDEVRPMGLAAGGVMGMKLDEAAGDRLVAMECVREGTELLLVRDDGQAKRVALSHFPLQGRYGKGVVAWKTTPAARLAGAALGQEDDRVAIHQTRSGARSLRFGDAPRRTRAGAGKTMFEVKETDRVTRVAAALPHLEVKAPAEPEAEPPRRPAKAGRRARATGQGKRNGKHAGRRSAQKAAPARKPAATRRKPPKKPGKKAGGR